MGLLGLDDPDVPGTADPLLAGVTAIQPGAWRRERARVEVRDGRIARVDAEAEPAPLGGAERFVLPGLIDLHTHLPPHNALNLIPHFCLMHLAYGVTSVRDAGDADGTALPELRRAIAERRYPMPRFAVCGPFIGGTPPRWPNTWFADTPQQAQEAVERAVREGSDWIKAYDGLTLEALEALKRTAARLGRPVMGHVPAELSYEQALIFDSQHFFGVPKPESLSGDWIIHRLADWQDVDERRMREIVELTLEHGIANTPTLVADTAVLAFDALDEARAAPAVRDMPRLYADAVWDPRRGIAAYRQLPPGYFDRLRDATAKKHELVARLHAAGADLRLGTDTQQPFVVPGDALHREMRLFADCGLETEEVWRLATSHAGEALGGDPQLGRIEAGAPADLLVFGQDPTRDLGALRTLEAVIAGGVLYRRADLDAALARHREQFTRPLFDRVSLLAARRTMRRPALRL